MGRTFVAALLAASLLAPSRAAADPAAAPSGPTGAPAPPLSPARATDEAAPSSRAGSDEPAEATSPAAPAAPGSAAGATSAEDAALLELRDESLVSGPTARTTARAPAGRVVVGTSDGGEAYWTTGRRVGVAMGAAGFAAVVAGGMLTVRAVAAAGERDRALGGSDGYGIDCPFGDPAACERARDADRERKTAQALGAVLLATGGSMLAGGVTLFVLSPPRAPATVARPILAPSLSARGASLTLTASF